MQLLTEILQSLYAARNVYSLPRPFLWTVLAMPLVMHRHRAEAGAPTTLETRKWNKVTVKELKDPRGRRKMCPQTFKIRHSLIW